MNSNYLESPFMKKVFIAAALAVGGFQTFIAQPSYTFTSAGNTGSAGPTQASITTAYSLTNLNGLVNVAPVGIQNFTVPVTAGYRIDAYGAQGGGASGGKGARMSGDFTLTAGQVINILVGQMGDSFSSDRNIGGGGGTYVITNTVTPLVIAGGGGAARSIYATADGTTGTAGQNGYISVNTLEGTGGTSGAGGGGASCRGGGGAGWVSNGIAGLCSSPSGQGGITFSGGGFGGGTANGAVGGFGGGGSSDGTNAGWTYSGGGGGYSGGGGASTGDATARGGGGGSYNAGVNQLNTAGTNTGHGRVIISQLCTIQIFGTGPNSLTPMLCNGQSMTLTSNAISNYSWSTGSTASSIVVSPNVSTPYSLSATSPSNCAAQTMITLSVSNTGPTVSASSSTNNICLGKSVTLNGAGAYVYTWTGGVTNGVSFSPSVTSNYTVTGMNGCGNATAAVIVTVVPMPIQVAAIPPAICNGQSATLTANSAGNSYSWEPTSYTTSSTFYTLSPQFTSLYTVTATDGTCVGSNTVVLTVNPVPNLSLATSATMVCAGDVITLTVSGAQNYAWTPSTLSGNIVTLSPQSTSVITVVGSNSFSCTTTLQQVEIVNPLPNVNAATNKPEVCSGGSATLTVTGTANSYSWSTGSQNTVVTVNPLGNSQYVVTGTNNTTGCRKSATVAVTVYSPTLTVSPSTYICAGESTTLSASGGNGITWNPGNWQFDDYAISPSVTSIYTVTGVVGNTNNVFCTATHTLQVAVNPTPAVMIAATSTDMCKGDVVTFTASGASSYVWSGAGTGSNAIQSFSITSTGIQQFSVTGTNSSNCSTTATLQVKMAPCNGISENAYAPALLHVQPNPSSGDFLIRAYTPLRAVLYNELGQFLRELVFDAEGELTVRVQGLRPGIYFVRVVGAVQPVLKLISE